jgi:hypothetical protein
LPSSTFYSNAISAKGRRREEEKRKEEKKKNHITRRGAWLYANNLM